MHTLSRISPLFDMPFFTDLNGNTERSGWSPSVNVYETDSSYTIEAEIPGIPPEQVDLTISDGVLTLKGEKQRELTQDGEGGRTHLIERSYGSFIRRIRLPSTIDHESVKATSANGVLRIEFAKRDNTRKIQINVDS